VGYAASLHLMALIRGTHYFSLDESHAVRVLATKLRINNYFITWWIFLLLWPLPVYFIPFAEMKGTSGQGGDDRVGWWKYSQRLSLIVNCWMARGL
jgi:hypothetical protein